MTAQAHMGEEMNVFSWGRGLLQVGGPVDRWTGGPVGRFVRAILCLCGLAGQLAGCGGTSTYQAYQGPERSDEEVALLIYDGNDPYARKPTVFLYRVDDYLGDVSWVSDDYGYLFNNTWDGGFEVAVLPGAHDLEVRLHSEGAFEIFTDIMHVSFEAQPGETYHIGVREGALSTEDRPAWEVWIRAAP